MKEFALFSSAGSGILGLIFMSNGKVGTFPRESNRDTVWGRSSLCFVIPGVAVLYRLLSSVVDPGPDLRIMNESALIFVG
jgi:hypothetical protein